MKSFLPVKILQPLLLTMALLAAGACSGDAQSSGSGELRIDLSFTRGETSKDSHEFVYSCVISGRSAVYSGPYGECVRGQCEHRRISFDLTSKEREVLAALVEDLSLYSKYSEARPVNNIGTWVKVILILSRETRAGEIRIEGMANNWGKRTSASAPEISLQAREHMKKLERLRQALTALAKKRFSKYH